jgi:thiol-disulfide isomerase/thioredoxin
MRLMRIVIIGALVLITVSCYKKPTVEFALSGTTSGISNGVILYLDHLSQKEIIDSSTVENNSFNFNTKLPKSPMLVVLRTKDFSHYRFLWLENNPMTFEGSKTNFRNAIVDGSESENLKQDLYKDFDTLSNTEQTNREIEFVSNNPNSNVSAYILYTYEKVLGKKRTEKLFNQFSAENKASEYGRKIEKYIELENPPKLGEKYMNFEMTGSDGEIRRLSDFEGKVILLEFWASWCGPCRQENPSLVRTYKKFKPKGFEIFAVSLDENEDSWLQAIRTDSLIWKHVSDLLGSENAASLIYGVGEIPDNFLIDIDGVIIARNLRGAKLNKKLEELMN